MDNDGVDTGMEGVGGFEVGLYLFTEKEPTKTVQPRTAVKFLETI